MNSKFISQKLPFLHKFNIQKVLFSKSAGMKNSQLKTWHFGNFPFQIFFVQENVCFRICFFFFPKVSFQTLIFNERVCTKSCLLKWARKLKNLLFPRSKLSQNVFFRCEFFIETWFLNKNWIQKLSFWKKFLLQNMIFEMFCIRNLPERKILNSKPDILEFCLFKFSLYRKTFASESDSFFRKISFQTLIFDERVCYKVMPFKMSTQSEKLVVVRGANRFKTLFLRCDVFIEIWFLNENWIQTLNFRKKFSLHKTIIGKKFFEIRQDEKLSIQKLINL